MNNDKKLKKNYYSMVEVVLRKYGYTESASCIDTQPPSLFHNKNYDYWKGKNETTAMLVRIRRSIEFVFKEKRWNEYLNAAYDERIIYNI